MKLFCLREIPLSRTRIARSFASVAYRISKWNDLRVRKSFTPHTEYETWYELQDATGCDRKIFSMFGIIHGVLYSDSDFFIKIPIALIEILGSIIFIPPHGEKRTSHYS